MSCCGSARESKHCPDCGKLVSREEKKYAQYNDVYSMPSGSVVYVTCANAVKTGKCVDETAGSCPEGLEVIPRSHSYRWTGERKNNPFFVKHDLPFLYVATSTIGELLRGLVREDIEDPVSARAVTFSPVAEGPIRQIPAGAPLKYAAYINTESPEYKFDFASVLAPLGQFRLYYSNYLDLLVDERGATDIVGADLAGLGATLGDNCYKFVTAGVTVHVFSSAIDAMLRLRDLRSNILNVKMLKTGTSAKTGASEKTGEVDPMAILRVCLLGLPK